MKLIQIGLLGVLGIVAPALFAAEDLPPMFPYVISYDAQDNASSVAHFLDAPAGKHGFVRVKDGHFSTDKGPIRFHATNITGPANFPEHAVADKVAARLARLGINCVRLHFMDTWYINFMTKPTQGILADDTQTQRNLDPAQLEKLDYMIAAFKKRGIYVNMNLHVGRTLDERDGFENSKGLPWANKGVGQFVPRMIELQKEYAKQLLTHVNKYTGNAYANEPCVAMIEISNEDSLQRHFFDGFFDTMQDPYAAELRRQWNVWLHKTYASREALQTAWKWKSEPLHDEQIKDGTFAAPIRMDGKPWEFAKGSAEATCSADNGALKISVTKPGDDFFPKLFRKLSLKKGEVYTLSLKVRRPNAKDSAPLSLAVASHQGGWHLAGMQEVTDVGASWKNITRVFESPEDTQAFLQVTRFGKGEWEIDDLSLQAGADFGFDAARAFAENSLPLVKKKSELPPQAARDFQRFLTDTETAYWTGMYDCIKRDLHAKPPVSGTQLGYSPPHVQAMLDYVDNHAYWRHPRGGWISLTAKEPWTIDNDSMVNSLLNVFHLAGQRVHNKPYTISEYNHPYPNQYGAEGQALLSIYGRLNGWDGVFQYSYNHYVKSYEPDANPWCFFDSIARTDVLAHFPACSAIFLRGDVQESKKPLAVAVDMASYREKLLATRSIMYSITTMGLDAKLVALRGTSLDFTGGGVNADTVAKISTNQHVFVSDTGEITWNTEKPKAAYVAVNAPNTRFFTGFPEGRTIDLGSVKLAIGKTRLGWATVSMVSRQGTGFGETGKPASILLAATGDCGNTGRVVKPMGGIKITLPERGTGPVLAEGIPATVTLPAEASRVKCFALDPHGNRKQEVPVEKSENGAKIAIDPAFQTVWYEIEVK